MTAPARTPLLAPAAGGAAADDTAAGALLAAHVPLSLLFDLAEPFGPDSCSLLEDEGGEAGWLTSPGA